MTMPALLLGFLISTAIGAVFHLWRGGGPGRLLFNLVLAWIGFWVGQYIGDLLRFPYGRLGPLHLALGTAFAIVFLLVGHFLSLNPEQTR